MDQLYYLRIMRFNDENSPSLKICLDLPRYNKAASKTSNSNISAHLKSNPQWLYVVEQGRRWLRFMKKNQRSKISCYCPFKASLRLPPTGKI
jgi:hypothetical protein